MLKRNPGYVIREFADVPYLIPFGQGITDFEKNVKLNETGVLVWEHLEEEKEKEVLLQEIVEEYDTDAETAKVIREDIGQFLTVMISLGMIVDTKLSSVLFGETIRDYRIADQRIRILSSEEYIPVEFSDFETAFSPAEKADLEIRLKMHESRHQEKGKLLVRNKEIAILEQKERYLILFHLAANITEAFLSRDGKRAEVYFELYDRDALAEEFFHAVRFFFLYMVQKKGYFALHSVSLLYRDKAWLFSGHSGMGKSTHTNFWKEALGTPILNGDLNLLSLEEGNAVIHGIPWCGTSGISDTGKYPLGGIILLKKVEKELRCYVLSEEEKEILTAQRLISPTWTEELQDRNLQFIKELAGKIPVWKLDHVKDVSSVDAIREKIDAYLEGVEKR